MILSKSPLLRHIGGDVVRCRVILEKTNDNHFCVRRQYIQRNEAGKIVMSNGNGDYQKEEVNAHDLFVENYKHLVEMGYRCDFSEFRDEFDKNPGLEQAIKFRWITPGE